MILDDIILAKDEIFSILIDKNNINKKVITLSSKQKHVH